MSSDIPGDNDSVEPGQTVDYREVPEGSTRPLTEIEKAVALKWASEEGMAPTVAASGQGAIARQILELAFAHDVKVREDADLVELLYALDIDTPIPVEAYVAVAEILSYVYRANNAARHGKPFETAEQP